MTNMPEFSRLLGRIPSTATYQHAVDALSEEDFLALDDRLANAPNVEYLPEADQQFIQQCLADADAGRDDEWYRLNGFEPPQADLAIWRDAS